MNGNIWSLHMLQFTRYILYMYLQNNTEKFFAVNSTIGNNFLNKF